MEALPCSAGYSAAKAYMLSFSEALHQELRGSGVSVTALAPGPVDTEFWEQAGWQAAGGRSFGQACPSQAKPSAREVAKAGVSGLANGSRVVVPGLPMRAGMLAWRYVPHAVKLPVLEKVLRQR
jgi:short-subunit dehydrogenase